MSTLLPRIGQSAITRTGLRSFSPSPAPIARAGIATSACNAVSYRRWGDDDDPPPRPSSSTRPQQSLPPWLSPDDQHPTFRFPAPPLRTSRFPRVQRQRWDDGPDPSDRGPILNRLVNLWSRTPRWVLIVIGIGGAYYVGHLEQVPGTGRWRFVDVSPSLDKQMGQQAYQETLQQYAGSILPPSHPLTRCVQRVATRLVHAIAHHPDHDARQDSSLWSDWDVHVIASDETNAFVLPGGHIFVFTGILPLAQTEDGLATVLGHEMAHLLARHSAEKMSRMKIVLLAGLGLAATLGWDPGLTRLGTTVALELPNSRKMESEADFLGLRLMAAACYDPSAAEDLWERMHDHEERTGSGMSGAFARVLSTHPVSENRMKAMHDAIPEAMQVRSQAGCGPISPASQAFSSSSSHSSSSIPSLLGFPGRPRAPW